jgi:hypothetical protein
MNTRNRLKGPLLAGLSLVLSCSRTEPQAASVASSKAGAQQPPTASQSAGSPGTSPSPPSEVSTAASPPFGAEVEIDGQAWDTSRAKVSAMDAWIGFVVDIESPQGERFSVHVKRGGVEGAHFMGPEVDVVYKRGDEWWRKKDEEAVAQIKSWRDDGPLPVVSLEWGATLLSDRGRSQVMRVEGKVTNVPIVEGEASQKK